VSFNDGIWDPFITAAQQSHSDGRRSKLSSPGLQMARDELQEMRKSRQKWLKGELTMENLKAHDTGGEAPPSIDRSTAPGPGGQSLSRGRPRTSNEACDGYLPKIRLCYLRIVPAQCFNNTLTHDTALHCGRFRSRGLCMLLLRWHLLARQSSLTAVRFCAVCRNPPHRKAIALPPPMLPDQPYPTPLSRSYGFTVETARLRCCGSGTRWR